VYKDSSPAGVGGRIGGPWGRAAASFIFPEQIKNQHKFTQMKLKPFLPITNYKKCMHIYTIIKTLKHFITFFVTIKENISRMPKTTFMQPAKQNKNNVSVNLPFRNSPKTDVNTI
jgi:hypothetical protein